MIRLAKEEELSIVANMMRSMYVELWPDHATTDLEVYLDEVHDHFNSDKDFLYVDEKYRGFFVVRDETEPMTPELHRFNGLRVYIHPHYRKSPLLALFYSHLFQEFPDGEILGMTDINSEHIPVMEKRHELIAKVYKLNRS